MPDILQTLIERQPLDPFLFYVALAALVVLFALLYACRHPFSRWRENRQIRKLIRRLAPRALRNLRLDDGTGGEVTIDYLLLTRECLLVVGVKRFSGLIFGGPQIMQWTQVIDRVSYKFPNPDDYLRRQIHAVHALLPDVETRGVHLFTHGARFSKDKPANVLSTRDLRHLPKRLRLRDIPAGMLNSWQQLQDRLA